MNEYEALLREPVQPKDGTRGNERPTALVEHVKEDPEPLVELANRHVVSARQFDRWTVAQLCRMAAMYETTPHLMQPPLAGKILISAFYEPSTRTRLSFESAWHRLGGDIMSITDPASTGIAKGESLADVAEMFNNYGDMVVLRDGSETAVYDFNGCDWIRNITWRKGEFVLVTDRLRANEAGEYTFVGNWKTLAEGEQRLEDGRVFVTERMGAGGVGKYSRSNFVHLDSGPPRDWGR